MWLGSEWLGSEWLGSDRNFSQFPLCVSAHTLRAKAIGKHGCGCDDATIARNLDYLTGRSNHVAVEFAWVI
jgi:hypothetical protein